MEWLRARLERQRRAVERPAAPIPDAVAVRLLRGEDEWPLARDLRRFKRGSEGVSREEYPFWVIRDSEGRVVGGAKVMLMSDGHPVSLDVAVLPERQGEGWATLLYEGLVAHGFDVEAGSSASLAHRTMSREGYLFMRARRLRTDRDAEAKIVASANRCPYCGPLDAQGRTGLGEVTSHCEVGPDATG